MFFSRKVRRKARNVHILTFFANPSYRLSILTRGSSQAEFETVALNRCNRNVGEFLNRRRIAAAASAQVSAII
jgi:hypothetical protein